MNPNVVHKWPRSLISNEGYEVGFTKHDRPYFNARPDATQLDPAVYSQDPTDQFPWLSRGSPLAIPFNVDPSQPILLADNYRNLLIIQNNSQGGATDVMPVLSINLDGPVAPTSNLVGGSVNPLGLSLAPGVGILLDTRIITNALYVRWGVSTNGGAGTFFPGAVCIYGRSPNAPPSSGGA